MEKNSLFFVSAEVGKTNLKSLFLLPKKTCKAKIHFINHGLFALINESTRKTVINTHTKFKY